MELIEGMTYISVRDYAEKRGISQSAVSQSMRAKRNAPLIEGHVIKEDGRFMLDEIAVKVLDDARNKTVNYIDSEQTQRDHEREIQKLQDEITDLKEQLKTAGELSKTLADTVQTITEEKKLLEDRREEQIKNQLLLEEKTEQLEQKSEQLTRAEAELKEEKSRAEDAEQKLRDIKNAGFWARRRLIKALIIGDKND